MYGDYFDQGNEQNQFGRVGNSNNDVKNGELMLEYVDRDEATKDEEEKD